MINHYYMVIKMVLNINDIKLCIILIYIYLKLLILVNIVTKINMLRVSQYKRIK